MASLTWDGDRARIQFIAPDGSRKAVRLGAVEAKTAERVKQHIEHIADSMRFAVPLDNGTALWLNAVADDFHEKLAAVGLCKSRQRTTLGEFIDQYIAGRPDVAKGTRTNFKQVKRRLTVHIENSTPLDKITPAMVRAYADALGRKYAEATASKDVKTARQFFAQAVKESLITENPFVEISTGSQCNPARTVFVERATVAQVLATTQNPTWHALIALSRYGGLRCPSEVCALRWTDVDFRRGRFVVRQHKTKHRTVPLFPEVRAALAKLERIGEFVIHRPSGRACPFYGDRFARLIRRAGLEPWPRVWHNMRASRETELVAEYPLHVVCTWIGNSGLIAQRHYLTVREEDYQRAALSDVGQRKAHA